MRSVNGVGGWPKDAQALEREQRRLAFAAPEPWAPGPGLQRVGGCSICFATVAGQELGVAGAALLSGGRLEAAVSARGPILAGYEAGRMALREGPLLEAAVRALPRAPEVLLVHAAGRDHPLRAGLAVQLGAALDLPTVGVTERPLVATGAWPGGHRGAHSPLQIGEERVGAWVRTRAGAKPVAVHAGWRTDPEVAVAVVLAAGTGAARLPQPLRHARGVARRAAHR
jgi:deoxyribonuclease V